MDRCHLTFYQRLPSSNRPISKYLARQGLQRNVFCTLSYSFIYTKEWIQERLNQNHYCRNELIGPAVLIWTSNIFARIKSTFVVITLEVKESILMHWCCSLTECTCMQKIMQLGFFSIPRWAVYLDMYVNLSEFTWSTDSKQCTFKCRPFLHFMFCYQSQTSQFTFVLPFIVHNQKEKQNPLKFLL